MKKLMSVMFVGLILTGCVTNEPYVKLSEDVLPKTVMITVTTVVDVVNIVVDKNGKATVDRSTETVRIRGAGVFISQTGHILTCAHLVWTGNVQDITIEQYNGDIQRADLLNKDDFKDLALMKINAMRVLPYAQVADPRDLKVGQEVLAVGNPLGLGFSVSHGILSALNRDLDDFYNSTQSDTFLNPGNSGGPLFNINGELVGINSRIIPPVPLPVFTGLGFSVQCGQIHEFLVSFKKNYEGLEI